MTQDEQWLLMEKYNGERSERFFDDCRRLQAGVPLAYVIGWIPFLGARIHLGSRPLIPRPETEYWTEKAVAEIKRSVQGPASDADPSASTRGRISGILRVLDLCAGSGCIGVAVAKALPNVQVDLAEMDPAHHATIQKNVEQNGIDPQRIRIFGGDLFERLSGPYDLILANPPYIDPALDRAADPVRRFEPHQALYGGVGGGAVIRRIIAEAPRFLPSKGQLWIEHEPEQSVAVHERARAAGFAAETHTDQYNSERYSILVLRA